ncbi:Methylated-DNA--protein-cysteine methyltransferase, putative [Perkinsus marinus ATCC 50983]|uniref:Methylated-DNA--protein-cysteine methyltransferase n=1 Tax=Perkinsus marinus (strain ATCC 50983 / TXsc) TaxID=423536 RepID=C5L0T6_PERM5|nr:Methylated-DNA--protein-cysteine methyltransferase, putative [Perkinsus marinus ATCC 50983]EER09578.1 Methylated-DNA--protein-cysteine methyltransferase, putative [Perkinsus marinus ATCC 50983]|eukprot:XP_002777783.1 Methylated-DNA--protein-cysteine methyltransferase, putative [Perkinsus marinus ATCC 50983]
MSIDLSAVSPFRRRVYEALLEVPKGKVTTYKELSRRIDCRSCQAVGQALKCNPFAPDVPCHRVVRASLDIGGFHGHVATDSKDVQRKIALLLEEGVVFVDDNTRVRVSSECLYHF